ncbi:MAG: guanylate kinase [Pseudomonadota bacterium]
MLNKDPLFFVISAPSGAGKTTVISEVLKKSKNLRRLITHTTRPMREGETDKKDYFFLSNENFQKKIAEDDFLEHANVYGNSYGSSKTTLKEISEGEYDIIKDIDVQGAMNIKKRYSNAILIYILTPSFEDLEKRLRFRNLDSDEVIKKRIDIAKEELSYIDKYDYCVENAEVKEAAEDICAIIRVERLKRKEYAKNIC